MKRLWLIPIFTLLLALSACSDETETPATDTENNDTSNENGDNSEAENIEEESAEENESMDTESNDEKTESTEEIEKNTENNDTAADGTEEVKSDLLFDINSQEVQSQLFGTTSGNEDGTFVQDAITNGMTQTEVEEKYGPYDFTFYVEGGASPAFYGNLAVVYSESAPYGQGNGNDSSDSNINPDENYVENVWYFAHTTEAELLEAFGEPDEYNAGDRTMNGLPHYIYEGEGEDGKYFITGVGTFNTPEGERIGLIKREIFDENPKSANTTSTEPRYLDEYYTSGFPVTLTEEYDYFTYDTLRNFIFQTYLDSLADYYNDVNNDVLSLLDGNALEKIQANKASGNFSNHNNYPGTTVSARQISDREYTITVNRTYSHATSNGEETSEVTYTVSDTDGMLKITDFQ